jgi:hypothetical protein
MHWIMQWSRVHWPKSPKQLAQVVVYCSLAAMHVLTHALAPMHFLPHAVMSASKFDLPADDHLLMSSAEQAVAVATSVLMATGSHFSSHGRAHLLVCSHQL